MYKIGMSTCGFELTEDNFSKLKKAGIDSVEISLSSEKYADINYSELKDFSKKYDIELQSYHLPFGPFEEIDISAFDKGIREYTIDYFSELIKKASDIGIDKFVIHPSGEPINQEERGERMKYSQQSLDQLAEIAKKSGSWIAVEDLPRTCLGCDENEIAELVGVNPLLKVCFDTNHLLKTDALSFMDKLADKIITVHISDYDKVNERHWLPGEGIIDWNLMLKKFKEINYSGVWMYEISLACPKTIIRERDLTFEDFYENAVNIFENKSQPKLSRHKENLGFWE